MSIQFETQEAFEQAIFKYLRDNLSFSVNSHTETVDVDYGNYQQVKRHTVDVELSGTSIAQFDLD